MKVKDFLIKCILDGDLDKNIYICVDKLLMKPVEGNGRYAYISIKEVISYGSCLYCTPEYSSGILYENLPPVKITE